jgi:hypothetical protein
MPDEGLFGQREAAASLSAFYKNRDGLIKLYKDLSQMADRKIPAGMKADDKKYKGLKEAEKLLKKQIKGLPKDPSKISDLDAGRLALALFLLERTNKIHDVAMKKNSLGLYSLYGSLRNMVVSTLDGDYYSLSHSDFIAAYLSVEPLLSACVELCGLAQVDIQTAMKIYKHRLAEEIDKLG